MKVTQERKELREMGVVELNIKLEALRRELFSLRLNSATAHIKDYSQFKKLRASIARVEFFCGKNRPIKIA
jgi:ribosomal protein L29